MNICDRVQESLVLLCLKFFTPIVTCISSFWKWKQNTKNAQRARNFFKPLDDDALMDATGGNSCCSASTVPGCSFPCTVITSEVFPIILKQRESRGEKKRRFDRGEEELMES